MKPVTDNALSLTEHTPAAIVVDSPAVELLDAKLIKPHTHAGVSHVAGDTIRITAAQRTWLKAKKVIAGDTLEK